MKKLLVPILACLVLGLVAVGCGDDDSSSDDAATTEQTATTETTERSGGGAAGDGAAQAEESVSVDVVDIDYEPRDVTVAKGTTVTWTNTGNLPHTVTKDGGPGPDFSSDTLNNGDTYEQTFDTPGTIDYVCKIHPQQTGTITVE